jgi:UDP:flavonoid glycosyltransferase YjiC (YdhE family)
MSTHSSHDLPARHIVLTTFGSYGDVHPYLAIARELQARGHRATLATSELYRASVEAAGVGFRAIRPDLPDRKPMPSSTRKLWTRCAAARAFC